MEVKVTALAALIGALGGLFGGGVTSVVDYFFGLEASRQELLQEARRKTYSDWSYVRTLSRHSEDLGADEERDEAEKARREFDLKGREVMGNIAVFGGQSVVKSVAMWYRTDVTLKPCSASSLEEKKALEAEINVHHAMRGDLLGEEQAVSDAEMSLLLLQCDMPTAR